MSRFDQKKSLDDPIEGGFVPLSDLILVIFFLFSTSVMAGAIACLQRLGRFQTEALLKESQPIFFYKRILSPLFKKKLWESSLFCLNLTRYLLHLCFAFSAFFFMITYEPFKRALFSTDVVEHQWNLLWTLIDIAIIAMISLIAELTVKIISPIKPKVFFKIFFPFICLILFVLSPILLAFYQVFKRFLHPLKEEKEKSPTFRIKDKILEILQESDLRPYLDPNDQKLILSIASFKERIAREVMVPRIDVFSLPSDTTLQEAAQSFISQGYSRIPVYKDNVDNVIGVLLYKDVLNIYARLFSQKDALEQLNVKIENLVKPVLYTPETKKISHLLQEFRNKKIHLAIVVDEYGGTEGIVTIEDILEELVGEIADEYDIAEEVLFTALSTGGWIVDAKMNIIDIEKELGVKIPQSPEYDTIGGYIFHRAGAIPSQGWRIHHDDFDLEVLSSDERSIDKIRITPHLENKN